jgi:hypothetical protein
VCHRVSAPRIPKSGFRLAGVATDGTTLRFSAASVLRFWVIHFIPAVYDAVLAAGKDRAEEWEQEECHSSYEQNQILRKKTVMHAKNTHTRTYFLKKNT